MSVRRKQYCLGFELGSPILDDNLRQTRLLDGLEYCTLFTWFIHSIRLLTAKPQGCREGGRTVWIDFFCIVKVFTKLERILIPRCFYIFEKQSNKNKIINIWIFEDTIESINLSLDQKIIVQAERFHSALEGQMIL